MTSLFAWRYFKAKKSTNAINIISWICIVAIVVGTASLILVLSVFNGFEGLVKSLYASFYPDLKISPASGKTLTLTQDQLQQIKGIHNIKNFSLVVEEKAILQNGNNQSIVHLKGVDNNYKTTTTVDQHIYSGKFDIGTSQQPLLVLGVGIEGALGIRAGSDVIPLSIYVPRKSNSEELSELENISSDTIHTAGSFMIQQDFDNKYVITNLVFLQQAMRLNSNDYSGVEILLKNPSEADETGQQLAAIFGSRYKIQNRYQQNQSLYAIMNLERWIFYAVLCIILIVAAFNMVGALTMLVLEKQKDISVLNALGAPQHFILKVFLGEGFLLAAIGGGIGMLIALALVILQKQFHLVPLEGGSFLINYFPVELKITDFILVTTTVLVVSFLAAWFPAVKASKQHFSLRSE
ncbi:FtsX-like permease family protein [Niabella ginsengisoli]|uniref:FtsX-like permease family protein n=1 Tax=Niabella ginsengisoli TaxID=522298 RepID=A0ABS9SEK2_9BACT|nr:FtsX-like permease family protein [Niabella ginsengisoli]MCH5596786.1 FtsX-like permease family protein [Niabella ginsengisoli]